MLKQSIFVMRRGKSEVTTNSLVAYSINCQALTIIHAETIFYSVNSLTVLDKNLEKPQPPSYTIIKGSTSLAWPVDKGYDRAKKQNFIVAITQ